jgi:hypothetical protein
MGFLDKMADAFNPVTGGGAAVNIAYPRHPLKVGEWVAVKVYVTSTGGEIKTNGVFVDFMAAEQGRVSGYGRCPHCNDNVYTTVNVNNVTVEMAVPLASPFVLGPSEQREFEAQVQVPYGSPTYRSRYINHLWHIRGRLDAFGNDPDSGYKEIVITE